MYVDVKHTIWVRLRLYENIPVAMAKKLAIENRYEHTDTDIVREADYLYDTAEVLPKKKNNGKSTVELYDDEGNLIITN